MTIPMALTLTSIKRNLSNSDDYVPAEGELFVDKDSMLLKVGDGKTSYNDLVWLTPPTKPSVSMDVKKFIEDNIQLIRENNYDELYNQIKGASEEFIRDLTTTLVGAGLNPVHYLTTVPRCIQDLFIGKVDNIDNKLHSNKTVDYSRIYTKPEIDAKLHEVQQELADKIDEMRKKMYREMCIPPHIMT